MRAEVYDRHTDIFLTDKEVSEFCKPGKGPDTCVWLVAGPKGWQCTCLNKSAYLLSRFEKGETVAKRDGCAKVLNFSPFKVGVGVFEI